MDSSGLETWARREEELLTPRQIYQRLCRFVIGQDAAKRAVAIAAYNHLKRIEARKLGRPTLLQKSNVLLLGPTGSGKTHLAKNLARILNVPFVTVDATEYTEAGYYGKDVEVMVSELLLRANQSVEEAQRGIIFVDEVDKIARRSQGAKTGAGARDIGGEGVQQALLKLLEGREVFVPLSVAQSFNKHDFVPVDTQDILFLCAGAFSDLQYGQGEGGRPIGFGATERPGKRRRISLKMLTDYGMLPEFLGRLPVMVDLSRLEHEDLVRILTEPPDSLIREYRELLALDGVELRLTDGALHALADYTLERGLGARGLRAALEHVLAEIIFEAPESRRGTRVADAALVRKRLADFHPLG